MGHTVTELWRYPVKSFGGERLDTAVIDPDGIRGDHVWAVVDDGTGHVASAKRARLWSPLLACSARLLDDTAVGDPAALEITLPGGTVVRGDDPRTAAELTALVGRPVSLRSPQGTSRVMEMEWVAEARVGMDDAVAASSRRTDQDPGSDVPVGAVPTGGAHERFYDLAPLHVLTTSSLNAVAPGSGRAEVRRFRPNVVVGPPEWDAGWVEDEWVESRLRLGAAETAVRMPTGRCGMVNLAHQELPAERRTLKTIAAAHRVPVGYGSADLPALGVYADVLVPGPVGVGDVVGITRAPAAV